MQLFHNIETLIEIICQVNYHKIYPMIQCKAKLVTTITINHLFLEKHNWSCHYMHVLTTNNLDIKRSFNNFWPASIQYNQKFFTRKRYSALYRWKEAFYLQSMSIFKTLSGKRETEKVSKSKKIKGENQTKIWNFVCYVKWP